MNYTFALDQKDPLVQTIRIEEAGKVAAVLGMSNPMHRAYNLARLEKWLGYTKLLNLLYNKNPVELETEAPLIFNVAD